MAKSKQNKNQIEDKFQIKTVSIMFKGEQKEIQIRPRVAYEDYVKAVNGCVDAIMSDGFNTAFAEYSYGAMVISVFTTIQDISDENVFDYTYESNIFDVLAEQSPQACSFHKAVQDQLEYEKSKSSIDNLLDTINQKIQEIDVDSLNAVLKKVAETDMTGLNASSIVQMVVDSAKTASSAPKKRGRPAKGTDNGGVI